MNSPEASLPKAAMENASASPQAGIPARPSFSPSATLPTLDQASIAGRSSVPASLCEAGNSLRTPVKSQELKKSKTWADIHRHSRRCEAVELTPAAIAHLHKLNEAFLKYSGDEIATDDTSEAALDATWGTGGSWQALVKLPSKSERKMSQRGLFANPRKRDAEALLRAAGAAAVNAKGAKGWGDTTIGQDNFSVTHFANGWEVLCVMDGHGKDGHWPAARACRTMPFFLQGSSCSQMLKNGQVEAALTHAFAKVQFDLKMSARKEGMDVQAAGCTAVCAMWHSRSSSVWVATAGDSRAVLLLPGKGVIAETQDHKPNVESEAKRVEASGGEIVSTEFEDGYIETRINIAGQDFPGIAMTRSLGDFAMKDCGVTAEPEVVRWQARPGAMILAASDGIWEFLSSERVGEMVLSALAQGKSQKEAIQELFSEATRLWKENDEDYCDDITVVLSSINGTTTSVSARGPCMEGVCATLPGCVVA